MDTAEEDARVVKWLESIRTDDIDHGADVALTDISSTLADIALTLREINCSMLRVADSSVR